MLYVSRLAILRPRTPTNPLVVGLWDEEWALEVSGRGCNWYITTCSAKGEDLRQSPTTQVFLGFLNYAHRAFGAHMSELRTFEQSTYFVMDFLIGNIEWER